MSSYWLLFLELLWPTKFADGTIVNPPVYVVLYVATWNRCIVHPCALSTLIWTHQEKKKSSCTSVEWPKYFVNYERHTHKQLDIVLVYVMRYQCSNDNNTRSRMCLESLLYCDSVYRSKMNIVHRTALPIIWHFKHENLWLFCVFGTPMAEFNLINGMESKRQRVTTFFLCLRQRYKAKQLNSFQMIWYWIYMNLYRHFCILFHFYDSNRRVAAIDLDRTELFLYVFFNSI